MSRRDPECRLPAEVLALADWHFDEAAWRRADLPRMAEAAKALAFACLGGQVQFRLSDGVRELYWQDFDPADRRSAETWTGYVARSWDEALFLVSSLPSDAELIAAARENFALEDRSDEDLAGGLWFVTYLEAEASG